MLTADLPAHTRPLLLQFGENPADGYLLPLTARSHPFNSTWHLEEPVRRPPMQRHGVGGPDLQLSLGDEVNPASFVDEANTPNRVQYFTGSQFSTLPPMDYVVFAGPDANSLGSRKMLPFLQALLQLSGQPHTHYLARNDTSTLSPNNLLCSSVGAVVGASRIGGEEVPAAKSHCRIPIAHQGRTTSSFLLERMPGYFASPPTTLQASRARASLPTTTIHQQR